MRPLAARKLFPLLFLLVLAVAGTGRAENSGPAFELPPARVAGDRSGADLSALDTALTLMGRPGMAAGDDESAYDQARRRSYERATSYGDRYRRNPDGTYGAARSPSPWGGGSVGDQLWQRALSAGEGFLSSWAEGWLGGYGNARVQVRVNDDGDVTGAGDFLLPLYDNAGNTFFAQFGLRTMTGDRVIGNFGLGHRFFPAETVALGYNLFLDQDFSRNHTRGGAGVEAWYDWLRLSANYYTPLSGWKGSEDYDSHFVEERPAEGFDTRLTGYLPFYRNLAVTGGFEKWAGDHVGAFGRDDFLNRNPEVWSYGLEWTPVPVVSASVNRRHSGGHDETRFGLTFNYRFDMPWEDQISSSAVAELRTVEGSRHEFVNRQNEMILEYQEKDGVFRIMLVGAVDAARNIFEFQVTTGFGKAVPGRTVTVSAGGGARVLDPKTGRPVSRFTTDADGRIQIQIAPLAAGLVPVTLSTGRASQTFLLNVSSQAALTLEAAAGPHYTGDQVGLTATLKDGHGQAISGVTLTWTVASAATPGDVTLAPAASPSSTDGGGRATATVKSASAQTVRVTVSATVGGTLYESTADVVIGSADVYTLEASPDTLTVDMTAMVTFTVKKNGVALTSAVTVNFDAANSANYTGLPAAGATDASGTLGPMPLKPLVFGISVPITAVIEGQAVICAMSVAG